MTNLEPCEFFTPSCEPASFWGYLLVSLVLISIAGLMSGATVGLLSLDQLTVRILEMEGTDTEKACASRVRPVVQQHHFLLVALVLINSFANEALPIFLSKLIPESVAIIVSVTCVLFFGEILPQAIFTGPRQLRIAAALAPMVLALMWITSPISYPIAKFLNWWLGESNDATRYKRQEIKALVTLQRETDDMRRALIESDHLRHSTVSIHSSTNGPLSIGAQLSPPGGAQSTKLYCDEVTIIHGALDLSAKTVRAVMIPIHRVFMLEYNTKLDDNVMADILASGHSRIPIYKDHPSNVVGVLLVKRLIVVDPEDERPVHELALRKPIVVMPEESCYHLLNEFQKGRSHIALVTSDADLVMECWENGSEIPSSVQFDGILTIEDVIEELIQEEIEDESDVFVHDIIKYWKQRAARKYYPYDATRVSFVTRKLKLLAERARRRVRNRHAMETHGANHAASTTAMRNQAARLSHIEVKVIASPGTTPLLSRSL